MVLLRGVGEPRRRDGRWGRGETHSTGAKTSYKTNLLTLGTEPKHCLSRSALLGLTVSSQKSSVTAEKSGASLKPAGVVNLGKLLLHFRTFFP